MGRGQLEITNHGAMSINKNTYPKHPLAQLILRCFVQTPIQNVVLSPGSRNAPLTIGLGSLENIHVFNIVDERVAAFFALGLAQQTKQPAVLVCTSGSALLNYYPAVAEAYYSHVPLIILSADRPKAYIDISDGQTIRQHRVFKNHCDYNVNLDEKKGFSAYNFNLITQGIAFSQSKKTPVHINVPFSEPLYETSENWKSIPLEWTQKQRKQGLLTRLFSNKKQINSAVVKTWQQAKKKLILIGTNAPCTDLNKTLKSLSQDPSVLILHEVQSNSNLDKCVGTIDRFLMSLGERNKANLQPDLLITIGGMVVSKKIKAFLRSCQLKAHWELSPFKPQNTYFQLTRFFQTDAHIFFTQLLGKTSFSDESTYQNWGLKKDAIALQKHESYLLEAPFSDLKVFEFISKNLPSGVQIQASNSSVIRYLQLFAKHENMEVFCNRGTSGIEGSTSTAIGAAVAKSNRQTVLITGDLSFFYDSNALWNQYIPDNFRIILINNGGGGIFRCIPGPTSTDVLAHFETPHQMDAASICQQFHIGHAKVNDLKALSTAWQHFFKVGKTPQLLEIQTNRAINQRVFEGYLNHLSKSDQTSA